MTLTAAWRLDEVARIVGGRLVGSGAPRVEEVTTDSRRVARGALFVALRGSRRDGHDFVAPALAAGAVAVVVDRPVEVRPRIEVPDTQRALRDLGARRRDELAAVPAVAVTGSTGKTSTKDLLGAAIPGAWASPRSYNNEIGVPLTVLGAPADATALVLEVGSRAVGQIRWLASVLRPRVAVITNLGVVHLETFGSRDALADAKWEIVEALEPNGTAVLPAGEARLKGRRHRGRTVTFGREADADVAVSDLETDEGGRPRFTLRVEGERRRVRLRLVGAHQAVNAAAATAAARALGVDLEAIVAGLAEAAGSPWRMQIHRGRFTVVNDAYNANPDSMDAALRTVAAMGGRRLAVLGRMAELGPITEAAHVAVGRLIATLGFSHVVVVGEDHGLVAAAGGIASRVEDREEAVARILDVVRPGDVVLVKASRSVGLEHVADALTREASV